MVHTHTPTPLGAACAVCGARRHPVAQDATHTHTPCVSSSLPPTAAAALGSATAQLENAIERIGRSAATSHDETQRKLIAALAKRDAKHKSEHAATREHVERSLAKACFESPQAL